MNLTMDEIIDFAKKQFDSETRKNDFKMLHPRVYNHPEKYLDLHKFIIKDEKPIGMYLEYPTTYRGLKLKGIGTLCVDKDFRNQGVMKNLFKRIYEENKDTDLLYLSGDKQRYERFGFYVCGERLELRIKFKDIKNESINIKEYVDIDSKIDFRLYQMYMQGNPNALKRDSDCYSDVLKTKSYKTYLVYNKELLGYLVYDKLNNKIVEVVLEAKFFTDAIYEFMRKLNLYDLNIELMLDSKFKLQALRMAENYKLSTLTNIKVMNYLNVINNLLQGRKNLVNGTLIIGGAIGKRIKIQVKGGIANVMYTYDEPDLSLDEQSLYLLLFSDYLDFYDSYKCELIASWFPLLLPVTITSIDSI